MEQEIQQPVSSQEMLNILNEQVETDGGTGTVAGSYSDYECAGNTSYECVRRSVNEISEILGDEREDWTAIGGLVPQLEGLNRVGEDTAPFMKAFGDRTTNDFDILTTSPGELRQEFRRADYNENGNRLEIDYVGPSAIPEAEEIIERSHYETFTGYSDPEIDATIRLPEDTDLFYTKILSKDLWESPGTSRDAEYMVTSGNYEIDRGRLNQLVGGNAETWDYIEELGF